MPLWLPTAAALVCAIAAGLLGVKATRLGHELAYEREIAAEREQDHQRRLAAALAPRPQPSTAPPLVLHAQGTRDGGATLEMKARASGLVVLAVPMVDAQRWASCQVVLRTAEGAFVWEDAGMPIDLPNLLVTIPATALPPGDYILTLSGRRRTGPPVELADHYFRVVE